MTTPQPIVIPEGTEDAPEQLLKQFADPLDCLRELLQNAIDAGSNEAHVACTFEEDAAPGLPGFGAAVLRVRDYGEGMDRHIIDTRLTRLFSSDKLLDRTKIGRFGIGFISVFAMHPDIVCVDTGRNGENWRVLFRPDRTFLRVYLPEPMEGTCVRLWKAMSRPEFDLFEPRVRRALRHHAQYLDIALTYQGALFNVPLHEGALVAVENRVNGETIVASYPLPGEAQTATFANHGLTLLSRPSDITGVSYVINSPRLEHTMGRDSVVQDEHYAELTRGVRKLSTEVLPDVLSQKLDEGLRLERADRELAPLQRQLAELIRKEDLLPAGCWKRMVARSPQGELYTLEQCVLASAAGRLFCTSSSSPLSAALVATGTLVLEDWQSALATALCRAEAPRLERTFFLPLPLPRRSAEARAAHGELLCQTTSALLRNVGAQIHHVAIGYLDYAGSGVGHLPAVAQDQAFAISPVTEALPQRQLWDGSERQYDLVLNADHPGVKALLPLAQSEPELSAYNLIKLCLQGGVLSPVLDSRLLMLAMEERCLRQETVH